MKAGVDNKIIRIAGKDYIIRKSPRAFLKFHEVAGHSISEFNSSEADSFFFIYACLWGGGLRISWDEFLELTDEEDANDLIVKFIALVTEPAEGKKKVVR